MIRVLRFTAILAALLCTGIAGPAQSRDGWQGRPQVCNPALMAGARLAKCQQWVATTMQPPERAVSCCGDGDAYIADEWETIGGQIFAVITGDYSQQTDDYPGGRPIKKGSKILIPPSKVHTAAKDGTNPTGHGIIFISPGTGEVLCYDFPGPLT